MKYLILAIFASLVFSACKTTEYIEVEKVRTEYKEVETHDTLIQHDSIFHEVKAKNDTIYDTLIKWKTQLKYKNVYIHDSIRDSIPYPVIKEKVVVEHHWTGWKVAGFLLFIIGIYIYFKCF